MLEKKEEQEMHDLPAGKQPRENGKPAQVGNTYKRKVLPPWFCFYLNITTEQIL